MSVFRDIALPAAYTIMLVFVRCAVACKEMGGPGSYRQWSAQVLWFAVGCPFADGVTSGRLSIMSRRKQIEGSASCLLNVHLDCMDLV